VTICTKNRELFFEDKGIKRTAEHCWSEIPRHFMNVQLDESVVMPNHLHGVIIINPVGVQHAEPLQRIEHIEPLQKIQHAEPLQNGYQHLVSGSLGVIIRSYKAAVTKECRKNGWVSFAWQRNYHEHIVRNEKELQRIRHYIQNNLLKWELDRENPESENFNLDPDLYWREIYEQP